MEEQNKNVETVEPETQITKKSEIMISKEISQTAIIIGSIVVAVTIIAVLLIVLLGGDSHVHNYGEWKIAKEATIAEKGEERSYCSCGAYQSKELPKLDHSETKFTEAKALIASKDYLDAYKILLELKNYNPAILELKKFHYIPIKHVYKMEIRGELKEYGSMSYSYNNNNLPVQITTSFENGIDIYSYTYDDNGNIIKIGIINYGGYSNTIDCVYDANGNIIKKTLTSYDGIKSVIDYSYDVNNNLIKKVQTLYGESKQTDDYTYDANGNAIKSVITSYDGSKNITESSYELVYIPFEFTDEELEEFWDNLLSL